MVEQTDTLPALVARYRNLASQRKIVEEEMKNLKEQLWPLVEATPEQKWTDEQGYARIQSSRLKISYDTIALEALRASLPEAKTMLDPHRRVSEVKQSLYVK